MKTYKEISNAYAHAYNDGLRAFDDVKVLATKIRANLEQLVDIPNAVLFAPHDETANFDPQHSPAVAGSVAYCPKAHAWIIGFALKVTVAGSIIPAEWLRFFVVVTVKPDSCVLKLRDTQKTEEIPRAEGEGTNDKIKTFVDSISDGIAEHYLNLPEMREGGGIKIIHGFGA